MIEIGENQRARGLMNMVDGVEQLRSNNFCRVIKDTWLRIVLMKYDSLFLDVFVQLLSSIRLIRNNTSLNLSSRCLVKAHNRIPFQSHQTQSVTFFG